MEEDFYALMTPDQIRQFETNKAARDVVCLLGQLWGAQNIQITQAQNTLIRDILLIEISIENANRAGALAKTTVGEYSRMAKESDEFVLLVKKHKTVSTHGPARTVFSPGSPFEICCFWQWFRQISVFIFQWRVHGFQSNQ